MSTFLERLRTSMSENNFTKSSLSRACGVSHTTVARWLKGSKPRLDQAHNLASALSVTTTWLLTGEGDKEPVNHKAVENLKARYSTDCTIPVLSWAHAGEAMSYEQMPPGYLESIVMPSSLSKNRDLVGMIVDGDSMYPQIEHGDKLVVMKDEEPRNGCYVVAKFKHDEGVMVRRYQILSAPKGKPEKVRLSPYNEHYLATEHHVSEFDWLLPVAFILKQTW